MEDRSLRLDGVTLEDMGEYSCEADNAVGSVTATGMLFVHCKLTIYNQHTYTIYIQSRVYISYKDNRVLHV